MGTFLSSCLGAKGASRNAPVKDSGGAPSVGNKAAPQSDPIQNDSGAVQPADLPGGCEPKMECLCCYGDYNLSEMRECSPGSGHHVCQRCINAYVSEQVDGNDSAVFKCIVDPNCQNKYSLFLLDETLSPKLRKRTNDKVFRAEAKKAGIDCW